MTRATTSLAVVPTIQAAREAAARFFAAEPAAVEMEYTIAAPGMVPATLSVWVGRDGLVYARPRFAN